eukprot:14982807-Heterocapsa_arctica.AAC.1
MDLVYHLPPDERAPPPDVSEADSEWLARVAAGLAAGALRPAAETKETRRLEEQRATQAATEEKAARRTEENNLTDCEERREGDAMAFAKAAARAKGAARQGAGEG